MKPAVALTATLAASAILATATSAAIDSTPVVVRVEEDWELTLNEPDPLTSSPQIGTQMNPSQSVSTNYAIFCLNYQEIPDFHEGGIEIQLWEGNWNTDVNASENVKFSNSGEAASWTQELSVDRNTLRYRIKDGRSQSFGNFGGDGFSVASSYGAFSNLNNYSVDSSVRNSGVMLGSNRVKSLRITQVRKYFSDETMTTDSTPKVVFEASND
jgi:hypothetical protein